MFSEQGVRDAVSSVVCSTILPHTVGTKKKKKKKSPIQMTTASKNPLKKYNLYLIRMVFMRLGKNTIPVLAL